MHDCILENKYFLFRQYSYYSLVMREVGMVEDLVELDWHNFFPIHQFRGSKLYTYYNKILTNVINWRLFDYSRNLNNAIISYIFQIIVIYKHHT